jgi:hypothetical protein
MVYNITKADGTPLVSLADGVINTTATSLALPGFKATNIGQAQNQDFVYLLQNFAFTSPPANPLIGQLWFDTVGSELNVYTDPVNNIWSKVTPPFDGQSGTATVIADNNNTDVAVIIANNNIIAVVCQKTILPAALVDQVIINDTSYVFAQVFPNGLFPGVNLPIDNNNYSFIGNATSANTLTTGRNISLSGDVKGNVMFNGGSNVTLSTALNNNFSTPGIYNTVTVDGTGRVTSGTNYIQIQFEGDVIGNSSINNTNSLVITTELSSNGVTAGSYNNVTVDDTGRVTTARVEYQVPLAGMILWPFGSDLIPNNYAICNGQTVNIPGIGTSGNVVVTPNMTSVSVEGTSYIMRIS